MLDLTVTKKSRGRPPGRSRPETVPARVPVSTMHGVDAYIERQADPKPTRPDAIGRLVDLGLAADRQRSAASKTDAAEARKMDAAQAQTEYEATRNAEHVKTERLRQVRLAKEEHDRRKAAEGPSPGDRQLATRRAKELAVGAVKKALANVDAPVDEKIERAKKLVKPPAIDKIRKPR